MSREAIRAEVIYLLDELSDDQLLHVLSYLTSRGFARPIQNHRFDARVKRIIEEKRGLFKRLAEWPEKGSEEGGQTMGNGT